jgi:hypothetical protein
MSANDNTPPEAPVTDDDREQRYIDVFVTIAAAVTALSETQMLMARDLASLRGIVNTLGDAA